MLSRGIKKSKPKNHFLPPLVTQQYSENVDINQLYQIIEPAKKLQLHHMCPVNDAKKMREAQQKNILGDVKENNLEKEFYQKFNKEIKRNTPVWNKINDIQKMSNEEAIQHYKYYRSMNVLGELEEVSYEESSILMESQNSLNARMFEDNFIELDYERKEEQMDDEMMNNGFENIFQSRSQEEVYSYAEVMRIEQEFGESYLS